MKRTFCFAIILALGLGSAQQSTFSRVLDTFNYTLRVAATPCPATFAEAFTEPTCYVHGYDDFFDFKERFIPLEFEVGSSSRNGYWRTVSLALGDTATQAFRSSYRLRDGPRLTMTYAGEFIVLEFSR